MRILSRKLNNLPVETKAGEVLGKINGFAVDTDVQSVLEYYIKPAGMVAGLVKNKLIISRGQIIEITAKKMVVDDNVVKEKFGAEDKSRVKQEAISGAVMKGKE
jgi:uncharacterized protein YrrD